MPNSPANDDRLEEYVNGTKKRPLTTFRCPSCAVNGQTVWRIPGKICPLCRTLEDRPAGIKPKQNSVEDATTVVAHRDIGTPQVSVTVGRPGSESLHRTKSEHTKEVGRVQGSNDPNRALSGAPTGARRMEESQSFESVASDSRSSRKRLQGVESLDGESISYNEANRLTIDEALNSKHRTRAYSEPTSASTSAAPDPELIKGITEQVSKNLRSARSLSLVRAPPSDNYVPPLPSRPSLPPSPETLEALERRNDIVRKYVSAAVSGDGSNKLEALANTFNLPTATAVGEAIEKLLNIPPPKIQERSVSPTISVGRQYEKHTGSHFYRLSKRIPLLVNREAEENNSEFLEDKGMAPSQLEILRLTIDYIQELESRNEQLKGELNELRSPKEFPKGSFIFQMTKIRERQKSMTLKYQTILDHRQIKTDPGLRSSQMLTENVSQALMSQALPYKMTR